MIPYSTVSADSFFEKQAQLLELLILSLIQWILPFGSTLLTKDPLLYFSFVSSQQFSSIFSPN